MYANISEHLIHSDSFILFHPIPFSYSILFHYLIPSYSIILFHPIALSYSILFHYLIPPFSFTLFKSFQSILFHPIHLFHSIHFNYLLSITYYLFSLHILCIASFIFLCLSSLFFWKFIYNISPFSCFAHLNYFFDHQYFTCVHSVFSICFPFP